MKNRAQKNVMPWRFPVLALTGYVIFSLLHSFFNIFNITLLIPLLDILFNNMGTSELPTGSSNFSISSGNIIQYFNLFFVKLVEENGKIFALGATCIAVFCSVFFSNLFGYFTVSIGEFIKTLNSKSIRRKVFVKITELDIGYFNNKNKGEILSRMGINIHEIENTFISSVTLLIKEPLSVLIFCIVLFSLSFELSLIAIILVPLIALSIMYISKKTKKSTYEVQYSLGNLTTIFEECITGSRVIKSFNGTTYFQNKFFKELDYHIYHLKKMLFRREITPFVSQFIAVSFAITVLFVGAKITIEENTNITPSIFITYIAILSQMIRPIKTISSAISKIQRSFICIKHIKEILETKQEIQNIENPISINNFSKNIMFKNVYFEYQPNTIVLKDINLQIEKGKTVALIGMSGAGKSTITDLIPRFYDIKKGAIEIDGINIQQYELSSLRNLMGIVMQDSFLFNDTIRNNIIFPNTEVNQEDMIEAAKAANAHDFIMELPAKYDTVVGDRGDKLSGGQKQRISIARAIFRNPPILILDEATSSLDTKSEKLVQNSLSYLMQNRTTLVIAHRLSTIENADYIYVIEAGEIIEEGSPEKLILKDGIYKKMINLQKKQYI